MNSKTLRQLLKVNSAFAWTTRNISKSGVLSRKKNKTQNDGPVIIRPGNCAEVKKEIASPNCQVGVVIGGSINGFGLIAAEQLLASGCRKVIVADTIACGGEAVDCLCKSYGKGRAKFYPCDIKNPTQIAGVFDTVRCSCDTIDIVFNDLDAIQRAPDCHSNQKLNPKTGKNAAMVTRIAVNKMRPKERLDSRKSNNEELPPTRIVVNCSTLLGFMGWPRTPVPVYCYNEPTVQVTRELAEEFPESQTGVRLACLLPSNRIYEEMALPDIPNDQFIKEMTESCDSKPCTPDPVKDKVRIGTSITTLIRYAMNGSIWFLDPPYSLREAPRLLHLPKEGEELPPPKEEMIGFLIDTDVSELRRGLDTHLKK